MSERYVNKKDALVHGDPIASPSNWERSQLVEMVNHYRRQYNCGTAHERDDADQGMGVS